MSIPMRCLEVLAQSGPVFILIARRAFVLTCAVRSERPTSIDAMTDAMPTPSLVTITFRLSPGFRSCPAAARTRRLPERGIGHPRFVLLYQIDGREQ